MKTVIFACVHNAGRSQMAAAFLNLFRAPEMVKAISAGTKPADRIQPEVVQAMREIGVDLSAATPQLLTGELLSMAQVVVTMGCGESCPAIAGQERHDWPVADPQGQTLERVRQIRDEIRDRVWRLVAKEGWYKLQPTRTALRRSPSPPQRA
jgi:arsenate reductase